MFLSPLFREALACISGAQIELYNTDGSQGAALGAGVGAGYYKSFQDAFNGLKKILTVDPDTNKIPAYRQAYEHWLDVLKRNIE
jgi:xylulokinase